MANYDVNDSDSIMRYINEGGGIGSYGEGYTQRALEVVKDLKSQAQSGNLSLVDYQGIYDTIAPEIERVERAKLAQNGQAHINVGASTLMDEFLNKKSTAGGYQLPFTKQEYAKLPDSVLPTQEDVKSGMFDETRVPIRRYAPVVTKPTEPTPTDGNLPAPTPVTPPGPDAGVAVPEYTGPKIVDEYKNAVVTDERQKQIEEEAIRQQAQSQQQIESNKQTREDTLAALSKLLTERTQSQLTEKMPGIYEDLNTRGLLRSSELGNATAREAKSLETANQSALAEKLLGYSDTGIAEQSDMLNRAQGFQSAGLQARLGLEDAEAQKQLAITLAELSKPSTSSGKTNTEKWMQGISTTADVANAASGFIPK